jgi:hypothetical protein
MNALHITLTSAKHTNRHIHGNKFGAHVEVTGLVTRDPAVFAVTFWKDKPGISIEAAYDIPGERRRFQIISLSVRDREKLIEFARAAIED